MKRIYFYIIIGLIFAVGISIMLYRSTELEYPIIPEKEDIYWSIGARVNLHADGENHVEFLIPATLAEYSILDEDFGAPGYDLSIHKKNGYRKILWYNQNARGTQHLFYRLNIYKRSYPKDLPSEAQAPSTEKTGKEEKDVLMRESIREVLSAIEADQKKAEKTALALLSLMNEPERSQEISYILNDDYSVLNKVKNAVKILSAGNIRARRIYAVRLRSGITSQPPLIFLEVYDGEKWVPFDTARSVKGLPGQVLIWYRGNDPLVRTIGGSALRLNFSVDKKYASSNILAQHRLNQKSAFFSQYSISNLPVEIQNFYRILLLIPVGALVLVIMRNIIGIRTTGTFMPILLSLAFRETTLLTGLFLFILVIGTGLLLRSYLSRMKLLMVPRISVVVIVVILIMVALSVLSYRLGLYRGLTITFFPMIILAWTIERITIVLEEEGYKEALIQSGGSIAVAIASYLVITRELTGHIVFNFPESSLVILSIIMLLGQYRGYRLTELVRFREFKESGGT